MKKYIAQSFSLVVILLAGGLAFAHGTSIKIDKKTAAPGETITVKGEGVGSNVAITLTLQGVRQDYALGEALGNEHGVFEKEVVLPGEIQPGTYTFVAAAGNAKATTRLVVSESAAQESNVGKDALGQPKHGDAPMKGSEMAGHKEMGGQDAKPEPMEIERSATTVETVMAWAMVLVSGVLGIGLLIRERKD